ncbi:NUDIX hydrolase [Streptomyces sp. NPDC003860]
MVTTASPAVPDTSLVAVHVVLAVVFRNGQILALRLPVPGGGSMWRLPSATRRPGECPQAAVRRAVFEETGLVITAGVRLSDPTDGVVHQACTVVRGTAHDVPSSPVAEAAWLPHTAIDTYLPDLDGSVRRYLDGAARASPR